MSGFAGVFRRDGAEVSASELDAMVETLAHRGPDGRGTWRDGPVGLGHQHLRTTPEAERASLPEIGGGGQHVLTMDARVDNRAELCASLGLENAATLSDDRLLLAAYDEWGVECFERVVGAFAVVVFDRDRGAVVCARDALGIKPFYYALRDDLFAFGSEPKAVLSLSEVPEGIDDASVLAFLADEFDDPEATFFESVRRLPPGRVLVVEAGSARTRSYWSLDDVGELDLPADEAYERRFRDVFTEAVRCRLRRPTGTRVASFLSGGLDSTSIACTAGSLLDAEESLTVLSVTHEGYPAADESAYLQTALDAYDFDSHVVDGGGTTPFLDLDQRLARHDAPFYPPLFVMQRLFPDVLADDGCRVLLDGLGGDQTLHYGTSHLSELLLEGRIGRFASEFEALADQRGEPRRSILLKYVAGPLAPRPARQVWRCLHGRDDPGNAYPLLDAEMAREAGFDRSPGVGPSLPTHHREEHRRRLRDPEQVYFVEVVDADLAPLDVEPRYPYFDRRLVEFCLALPLDQKMEDGLGRQIARRALSGVVPEAIRTRTDKASLGVSWLDGLVSHERDQLRDRLVESPQFVDRYVDDDHLESTLRRFTTDSSPSLDDGWSLTKAYAVETWFRNRRAGR